MTIQASTIISRVRTQLIDADGTRWSDTELLQWLSDAARAVSAFVPVATSTTIAMAMVAGTKQALPSDANMLLSVMRNLSGNDLTTATPGRATRIVGRDLLDAQNPNWHTVSATSIVQNYVFELQQPNNFYVYPPNNGHGFAEVVYSVVPAEITSLTQNVTIQPIYQTALFDYVMFRAHQKDSDYAAGAQVAQMYLQLFLSAMGQGSQGQTTSNPSQQVDTSPTS